ncbi:MAG: hypothetical protein M9958_06330 [Chitinophagales bacterium]|nr:hypothetical protein [Chitinophagales bacterium]
MKIFLTLAILFVSSLAYHASAVEKPHFVNGNIYYNLHNQYYSKGIMMDASYGYIFNRWVGIGASIGMNRAQVNLNNWRKDWLNYPISGRGFDFPSMTSSILVNVMGNFYCIQNDHHHLKLGLGIEYRNVSDIITIGLVQPLGVNDPASVYTNSRFENFNDLGLSGNLSYTYFFKNGLGINTVAGYHHYFSDLSKRAYNRATNESLRWGGGGFLKFGVGIVYQF